MGDFQVVWGDGILGMRGGMVHPRPIRVLAPGGPCAQEGGQGKEGSAGLGLARVVGMGGVLRAWT